MSTVSSCRALSSERLKRSARSSRRLPTTNVGQAGRCVAGLFRYRSSYSSFSDSSRRAFSRLRTAGDHQHELAARLRPPEMLQHFGRCSAHGLLELRGQLARHGTPVSARTSPRTVRTLHHAVGRFAEDHRPLLRGEAPANACCAPFFWAGNPSETRQSQGKPLCTSAGMQAVAPGTSPLDPPARRRCAPAGIPDRRYPAFRRRRSSTSVRPTAIVSATTAAVACSLTMVRMEALFRSPDAGAAPTKVRVSSARIRSTSRNTRTARQRDIVEVADRRGDDVRVSTCVQASFRSIRSTSSFAPSELDSSRNSRRCRSCTRPDRRTR